MSTTTTKPTMTDDFGDEVTEARVLPLGGGGNIICGRRGYAREMAHRREMNRRNGSAGQWDLPAWESLRVYFPEPAAFDPSRVPESHAEQINARFGSLDR